MSQTQLVSPDTRPLRAWQRSALARYLATSPRDFLAVATPGAGKTTFALRVASELLRDRVVDAITVVTPTEHLKYQWAESAAAAGIALDPSSATPRAAPRGTTRASRSPTPASPRTRCCTATGPRTAGCW